MAESRNPAKKSATPSRAQRGDPSRAKRGTLKAGEAPVKADGATIRQALEELGINRPYYTCRVVGGRLELVLYGGDVVTWPQPAPKGQARARRRKS